MSFKDKALEYLGYGLTPVPVNPGTKEPLRKGFAQDRMTEEEIDEYEWGAIGIATGNVSQGLEVIDIDTKNAEDPEALLKSFKAKISRKLLSKITTEKTKSGGLHLIYRCEEIEGNRKLAMNKNGEAVLETRGIGGFIVCAPTEGYQLINGDFSKIPILTPEERLELFVAAKMLDRQIKKEAKKTLGNSEWLDKFPEYDSDIAIGLQLLEDHGWTLHSEDSEWVNLTRPGKTQGISAGYHKEGKFLWVFSSSTGFEENRAFNNHHLYAELECDGNYRVAYAKLYEQGYGSDDIDEEELKDAEWKDILQNMSFVSSIDEEMDYLEKARRGEIQKGKSTGWPKLDEYMRMKDNSFNMGLAYDGVGKSLFMRALAVSTNILHGMKWGMVVPENKTAVTRRSIMEIKSGQDIDKFKGSSTAYKELLKYSHDNFKIVTNQRHYSLQEVIEMGKKMYEVFGINALLIDPYNFFRVDSTNGYSWNNQILSELRVFADKYCSVYIMAHPSSEAPRKNKDADGFLTPPSPYQIQGGADFPYRVDDFFILHRIKNHPDATVRRSMQVIMSKVKEDETGGRVHPLGEYTTLEFCKQNNFLGYWDADGNNPLYTAAFPKGEEGKFSPSGLGDFLPSNAKNVPWDTHQ